MTEEKEAGGMNAGDASTNDSSSLSRQNTGPSTAEGKARSKYNAVKHGILSKALVLKSERVAEFNKLAERLAADLHPQGALEEFVVDKICTLVWRYRRLLAAEAKLQSAPLYDESGSLWTPDRLLRYESQLERAFDRALTQLERLQRMRLGESIPPPVKLDITSEECAVGR